MTTNLEDLIIKLCVKGARAEFEGRKEAACELYRQAWELSRDDYQACIAAHYVARCQESPLEIFRWNREALERANAVADERVKAFYPSLYLNIGHSYELLGDHENAMKYFNMAAELGFPHQID